MFLNDDFRVLYMLLICCFMPKYEIRQGIMFLYLLFRILWPFVKREMEKIWDFRDNFSDARDIGKVGVDKTMVLLYDNNGT